MTIRVRPAANLSKLEEVLVVTKLVEQEPTQLETGPVRAADILAQRLPSVPDKPAASDANKTGDSPKQTAEAPKTSAPASKPAAPAAAPNTNASTPPKSEKLPPKPQAEAPPIKAASPNAVQPHSVAAVPSALKPATEKGPVPAPVRVVDAPPVASKPNSTPPAAKTLPSAPPQDGPQ